MDLQMHSKNEAFAPLFMQPVPDAVYRDTLGGNDAGYFSVAQLLPDDYLANCKQLWNALTGGAEFDSNMLVAKAIKEGDNWLVKKLYPPLVYAREDGGLVLRWGGTPIDIDFRNPPAGVEYSIAFTKLAYDEAVLSIEMFEPTPLLAQFSFMPVSGYKFTKDSTQELKVALKKGDHKAFDNIAKAKFDANGKFVVGDSSYNLPLYDLSNLPDGAVVTIIKAQQVECTAAKSGAKFIKHILVTAEGSPELEGNTQYKLWSDRGTTSYLNAKGKLPFDLRIEHWERGDKSGVNSTVLNAEFEHSEGGLKLHLLAK